ncbi:MAG: MBL fold metallo-hydrolase [Deltaproteobacteria bacterium]|nr:MBL fold metallo-hydrolase [Deltaproteobacteria bacterium]
MAEEGIFVHQFELGPWDNFIYFIGDKATREVAVVDPAWHAGSILAVANELDVKITDVLCTHSHFDHVDMVDPVVEATDARVHMLGEEIDFSGFKSGNLQRHSPGDTLTLGKHCEVTFMHTPGHTPGSTSYRLRDAIVSGDTLFINGCGRCDFVGGDPETMYRTLHQLVDKLPSDTMVFPGHNYGPTPTATIESQSADNPFILKPTLEAFIAHRMEGKTPNSPLPDRPDWSPED